MFRRVPFLFVFLLFCCDSYGRLCEEVLGKLIEVVSAKTGPFHSRHDFLGPLFSKKISEMAEVPGTFGDAFNTFKGLRVSVAEKQYKELEKEKRKLEGQFVLDRGLAEAVELLNDLSEGRSTYGINIYNLQVLVDRWKSSKGENIRKRIELLGSMDLGLASVIEAARSIPRLKEIISKPPLDFEKHLLQDLERIGSIRRLEAQQKQLKKYVSDLKSLVKPYPELGSKTTFGSSGLYSGLYEKLEKTRKLDLKNKEFGWEVEIFLKREGTRLVKVPASNESANGTQKVILHRVEFFNNTYQVLHGGNFPSDLLQKKNMEVIHEYLGQLWRDIVETSSKKEAAEKIAEFEFIFMMANYPGRGGASIGDALSLTMQLNKGLKIRDGFESVDHNVIASSSLEEYIARRVPEMYPSP